jgi:general stress protein 26
MNVADNISETMSQDWVKQLMSEPILARLATADPRTQQPHVVPVWFEWDAGCVWISAFRSTRKVKELCRNPRISVVVDTDQPEGKIRGVIFEGACQLQTVRHVVEQRSLSIYTRYLGPEGVLKPDPQSWIHDSENLIICLNPERVYAWSG